MGNYATVAEVKAYKSGGVASGVASSYSDAEIEIEIGLMESFVDSICGDVFYPKTETNLFDGKGLCRLFFIPQVSYRLVTVTSVKEYDLDGTTALDTFVENVDFKAYPYYLDTALESDGDSPRRAFGPGGHWPKGQRNIAVAGTWGRSAVPPEVKRAVLILVLERLMPGFTRTAPADIKQATWPDFTVTFKGTEENIGMSTGFAEVDRLLKQHVNYADLFLSVPDSRGLYGN